MAHARGKTGRTCILAVKRSEVVREPGHIIQSPDNVELVPRMSKNGVELGPASHRPVDVNIGLAGAENYM